MTKYAVSGLTLIAFALRLHQLGRLSLWYDELLELDIALGPLRQIWPQLHRHAAMPLDYFILHGWLVGGRQEAWVRFPALTFGVLCIPLVYVLGRHLFGLKTGLVSAILMTVASFSVRYSQEARPYALLLFLTTLTFWSVWRAYQTEQYRYWLIAFIGLMGAVLSHYFALFLLAPLGLFIGVKQIFQPKNLAFWKHTALFALCLTVIALTFLFAGRFPLLTGIAARFVHDTVNPQNLVLPAEEKPNGGSGPPLDLVFVQDNIIAPFSANDTPSLVFSMALILSTLLLSRGYGWAKFYLLGWLIIPALLIYLFLLSRGTFFAVRYILYLLPPFLILVAGGIVFLVEFVLQWIQKQNKNFQANPALRNSFVALLLLPLLFAEGGDLLAQYSAEPYENWRAVGEILQANALPGDAVIAVRAEPAINWYYPPAQAPYGTYSVNEAIWQTLEKHPRRWFVLSSYSSKTDSGLRQWLHEQGAIPIEIDRRVIIYFHEQGLSKAEMLSQLKNDMPD